jgi:hypothetical protein
MKKLVLALIALIVVITIPNMQPGVGTDTETSSAAVTQRPAATTDTNWRSGSQINGSGIVVRVLSDDNDGSRHQRFILEVSTGRTVLIAHNIDLAPRVRSLSEGDTVSFFGQYESNDRGGVIHWTHKDPQGRHVDGWLEHDGQRYQ